MSLLEDTILDSWTNCSRAVCESVLGYTGMILLWGAIFWWHFILFTMENSFSKSRYLCLGNYYNVSHGIEWKICIKILTDWCNTIRLCSVGSRQRAEPSGIHHSPGNTFKSQALKQCLLPLPCLAILVLADYWQKWMRFSKKFLHKLIITIWLVLWFQAVYSSAIAQLSRQNLKYS